VREGCFFFFFFFFFFFSCMGRRRRGHTQHSMLQQAVLSWLAWEDKGCPPPVHRAVRPSLPLPLHKLLGSRKGRRRRGRRRRRRNVAGEVVQGAANTPKYKRYPR
jgi:hypothetical protein